jgi:cell wall-associated NlpC family hydrolase
LRRLVLVFFVVLVAVGVAGVRAESAPKSNSKSTPYWQVVDNATEDRFEADKSWGTSSYRLDTSDDNHRFARPAEHGTPAQFKVDIPETADYAVYASRPEVKGLSDSVPVGVETTSGLQWTKVNQQQDGGRWVRIGTFEMAAGDDYSVQISPATGGEGYVAADAVEVVKVSSGASSPEKPPESDSSANSKNQDAAKESQTKEAENRESGSPRDTSASSSRGQGVVNEARTYMGVRYRLGGRRAPGWTAPALRCWSTGSSASRCRTT